MAAADVGLGVAVMLAVSLANLSVTDTFRAAVDSVSGNTSVRIHSTAGRFDERPFADLDRNGQFGHLIAKTLPQT